MGFDFGRALNDLLLPSLIVGGGYLLYKAGVGERLKNFMTDLPSQMTGNNGRALVEQGFDNLVDRFMLPAELGRQIGLETGERLGERLRDWVDNLQTPADLGRQIGLELGETEERLKEWLSSTPLDSTDKGDTKTTTNKSYYDADYFNSPKTVVESDGSITVYDKVYGKTTIGGSSNSSSSSNYSSSGGGSSTTSSRHYVDSAGNIRLKGGNK